MKITLERFIRGTHQPTHYCPSTEPSMAKNPKPLRKHKRKFYRAMQRSGTTFHEVPAMPPPLPAKERIGRRPISPAEQLD